MVADGDRLVVYISTTGTHAGSFMGMAPTGRKFKVNGVDIFRFNDEGKVFGALGRLRCTCDDGAAHAGARAGPRRLKDGQGVDPQGA